jgi:hypothetical protein
MFFAMFWANPSGKDILSPVEDKTLPGFAPLATMFEGIIKEISSPAHWGHSPLSR